MPGTESQIIHKLELAKGMKRRTLRHPRIISTGRSGGTEDEAFTKAALNYTLHNAQQ